MTISEFKAFLEGMDVQECPTPEQWARIRDKIDGLEVVSIPAPVVFPTTLRNPPDELTYISQPMIVTDLMTKIPQPKR